MSRRNKAICLVGVLLFFVSGLAIKLFAWNDTDKANTVSAACENRKPAKLGEKCTDTITYKGARAVRHYVAERIRFSDGATALHFDRRTIAIEVDAPTLDNFCAADAIASIRPDKPTLAMTADANSETCGEIRALTVNPAYDADYWCEYKMRNNLEPGIAADDNWDRVIASYFTDEAIQSVCSTPLPTPHGEATGV